MLAFAAPVSAQESLVRRGLELEDSGQWEAAAALYREAIDSPEMLSAAFGLERALLTLNRGDELVEILSRLVRRHASVTELRTMYVRTLSELGRAPSARAFVNRWISERPSDPEAYRQLFSLGPLSAVDARTVWSAVRDRADDSSAVILSELGERVVHDGLWAVAREMFADAHRRRPSAETAAALALAHARTGAVADARVVISSSAVADDAEANGWLALYDGDVARSRRLLRAADRADAAALLPLAVVARAPDAIVPELGDALLRLVRGDTSGAARAFARAAPSLGDARTLVLAWAARLQLARGNTHGALALYDEIARDHPHAPEAPEAVLAQARALARRGDAAAAAARLEHLIVSYPESAELPRARRELDALRGSARQ